jgi:hypothetical protein
MDWGKEVEHSARVTRAMLTHLTSRFPNLFSSRDVPWYEPSDDDIPAEYAENPDKPLLRAGTDGNS